jgi:hypothetical protein
MLPIFENYFTCAQAQFNSKHCVRATGVIPLPTEISISFYLCSFYRHKTEWMTEHWTQPVYVLILLGGDHIADMPNWCTSGGGENCGNRHKHVLMHIHFASCQNQHDLVQRTSILHTVHQSCAAHNWFPYNETLEIILFKIMLPKTHLKQNTHTHILFKLKTVLATITVKISLHYNRCLAGGVQGTLPICYSAQAFVSTDASTTLRDLPWFRLHLLAWYEMQIFKLPMEQLYIAVHRCEHQKKRAHV